MNLGHPDGSAAPAPVVSIGMPVYNGARYLRDALDALLAQTWTDFELVISDNASTDETERICRAYAQKDARIRYVRQEYNHGPVFNFRYVLDEARGKYFMWAACDDRWEPFCLSQWVSVLEDDGDCGLVFSDYGVVDLHAQGGTAGKVVVNSSCHRRPFVNYLIRLFDLCPSMIYGLHRLSTLRSISLENFDFGGLDLVMKLAVVAKVKVVPHCLYFAGTKGAHVPYSITGSKLNRVPFLKSQWHFLRDRFGLLKGIVLFVAFAFVMGRNKLRFWGY